LGATHAASIVRQEVQEAVRQLALRPVFLRLTTNDEQARRTAGFFVALANDESRRITNERSTMHHHQEEAGQEAGLHVWIVAFHLGSF